MCSALCVHTWQVCDLIEELVLHASKLVVGVVRGGRVRRRGLPLHLLLGRPTGPRPRHADQSHHCSVKTTTATTNGRQISQSNNEISFGDVKATTNKTAVKSTFSSHAHVYSLLS